MNTYLFERKTEWNSIVRRMILAGLFLFILFSMGGCGRDKETELKPTPTPEGWEYDPGVPTIDPTQPSPTMDPDQPKPTTAQITDSTKPQVQAGTAWKDALTFPIVTPVPQSQITDIKGKIAQADFPKVDGSTATIPLSEAVYQYVTGATAEEAANAIIHTKTSNCYKRLYNREVDLLIVYEPSDEIVERMKSEELIIKPIGLDALVFMANTANPVSSLTTEQLVDIYSGKITNWSEVGGEDKQLMAFQRPNGGGSQSLMLKLVMKNTAMVDGSNVFRYSTMSDILEGMLSYNGEDNTLGYSVFYYANNMYYLPDLKFVGVDGVLPSLQTIYDGSYPLVNAFYAVIRPNEPENSTARTLFDWLTGDEGQQVVLDCGYVPVDMPKDASLTTVEQNFVKGQTEVTPVKSLNDGEYFVFFTPQNETNEFEYGNATIYDKDWKACANFYNVVMNSYQTGVIKGRYLPIGQIRMNAEGQQETYYGVYDMEQQKYSVTPQYRDLVPLDMELGYYAVVEADKSYLDYFLIDGTGAVRLETVAMDDWLMITKYGDCYLETVYDYGEYWTEFSAVYNFYDLNLNLLSQFYTAQKDVPSETERKPGVNYYYVGDQGCLLDGDGTILIDAASFLAKYGKTGDDETDCVLPFYGITVLSNEAERYAIEYGNQVYIVDKNLELCRMTDKKTADYISNFNYYEDFYYGYNYASGKTQFYTYDDVPLRMKNSSLDAEISFLWEDSSYLLYAVQENAVLVEEHTADNEIFSYEIPYENAGETPVVVYAGNHNVYIEEWTGKTVQDSIVYDIANPYSEEKWYSFVWFYEGREVYRTEGTGNYFVKLNPDYYLWDIDQNEVLKMPTESVYEDYNYRQLNRFAVIKDGVVTCDVTEPAYRPNNINGFLMFMIGNYTYVMDYEGNVYLKALNNSLESD